MDTRDRTAPNTRRAFSRRDFVTHTAFIGAGVALGPPRWAAGSSEAAELNSQNDKGLRGGRRLLPLASRSASERPQQELRKADVVSAFGTVPSEVFFDVFGAKRRTRRRPSLLYRGNDLDAKHLASTLIRDVGFEAVDAGPLKIARYLEPFALAMAPLAYERDSGPEIAYRIEHFKSRG